MIRKSKGAAVAAPADTCRYAPSCVNSPTVQHPRLLTIETFASHTGGSLGKDKSNFSFVSGRYYFILSILYNICGSKDRPVFSLAGNDVPLRYLQVVRQLPDVREPLVVSRRALGAVGALVGAQRGALRQQRRVVVLQPEGTRTY